MYRTCGYSMLYGKQCEMFSNSLEQSVVIVLRKTVVSRLHLFINTFCQSWPIRFSSGLTTQLQVRQRKSQCHNFRPFQSGTVITALESLIGKLVAQPIDLVKGTVLWASTANVATVTEELATFEK